jgi:hypothetical protein
VIYIILYTAHQSHRDVSHTGTIEPWGLIYRGRAAYSDLVELPNGKIAVVFERSNSSVEEYRYVSVAVVTPSWHVQHSAEVNAYAVPPLA